MKIAYITEEQYNEFNGKKYCEHGIFFPLQDDITNEYYITNYEIENLTDGEFLWLLDLNLVDIPEHERYKFKTH